MFETSKHSIRSRQALEVERLAQLLERLDTPLPPLLGRGRVVLERELRVLLREPRETQLLAALRRAHLDTGSPEVAEVGGERFGVPDVGGDDHLRRHGRRPPVVLDTE